MIVDIFSIVNPLYMQIFAVVMIVGLVGGMAYDFIGGKKLEFTLRERRQKGRNIGIDFSAAFSAIFGDVATSRQFAKCSSSRRASHILMMWGFIISIILLFIEVFFLPFTSILSMTSPVQILLIISLVMLLIGALWFLPQRANVRVDGDPVYKLRRADIFVINVIVYSVLGLALEAAIFTGSAIAAEVILGVSMFSLATLFLLTPFTKLPHMFYKGGLIIQDKMEKDKVESRLPR
ncbi:MAG: hypothetical protein M1388_01810 [Thaumarchaeota archaeon]|nr:hypothetical protein [Nitrososphaerota archaeon]